MIVLHIPNEEYSNEKAETIKEKVKEIMDMSREKYSLKRDGTKYIFLHEISDPDILKTDVETAYLYQTVDEIKAIEMFKHKEDLKVLEKEIKTAIAEDRVMIYLQPIYSNKAKRFTSAEVLTRIKRNDGSFIMPAFFIPAAEEIGIISELEDEIIKKTCQFLVENDIKELGMNCLEVNLSIKNGEQESFAKKYEELITSYGISPNLINFEITETASLSEKKKLLDNMNKLISSGFNFSLDDFGCGESNLNYIIDMPIMTIKFDRNMSLAYMENKKAETVMKSTVKMAHDLGLKTVSEGIEDEDMLKKMEEIGIDYIQGYYFSKPLPTEEFITFIKNNNI